MPTESPGRTATAPAPEPAGTDGHGAGRPRVVLLGPQRHPTVDTVLRDLGLCGRRVGMVTAGWREREPEDELLADLVGGNAVNLRLWHRMQQVWEADPELAEADTRRRARLEEMQELYLRGLGHAMHAVADLAEHHARHPDLVEAARDDAVRIIRRMDTRHLERVAEVHAEFWGAWPPHERPALAEARAQVAADLAGVEALVVTGGHVGVLVGAMHLFNVAPQVAHLPVIAWGAGAMALTDRVVLFHDRAAHGPAVAEVFTGGLGMVHDVVALPSARDRLALGDRARMALLQQRFAPARCVPLDERVRVEIDAGGRLPDGTPVLGEDGAITGWRDQP
ncbi:hypothetical protein [Ornithinicoccus halotolerans]|uniref:hypothetical protein n=1 Tax=Ornithinicoccus halotolerans TaxID=1748220 RepID=UPI00129501BF|nr:hypothetical protein [Ornithinicoccus halotolerans]